MRRIGTQPGQQLGARRGVKAIGLVLALHPCPGGVPDGIFLLFCHEGRGGFDLCVLIKPFTLPPRHPANSIAVEQVAALANRLHGLGDHSVRQAQGAT